MKKISIFLLAIFCIIGSMASVSAAGYQYNIDGVNYKQHGNFGVWTENQQTDGFIVGYDIDVYDDAGVYVGKADIIRHNDGKHDNSAQAKNWRYPTVDDDTPSNVTDDNGTDVPDVPVTPVGNGTDGNVTGDNGTDGNVTDVPGTDDNNTDVPGNNSSDVTGDNGTNTSTNTTNGEDQNNNDATNENGALSSDDGNVADGVNDTPDDADSNGIEMQHTGSPIVALLMVLCTLIGGIFYKKD